MKHAAQAPIEMDPRQMRRVLRHCVVAAFLALVIAGCSKKANPGGIQATADSYFRAGKYDEAKIEYTNLLRADHENATAIQQIGLIWCEQGAPMQAIPYLLKSRELSPGNLDVRMKLAQALISVGDVASARKEAVAILQQAPAHDEGILLLAETAVTKEDIAATEQELQKVKEPDRAAIHLASATLSARKRDFAAMEEEVKKALALDPKSARAHLAMANLFLGKKDTARAGESFRTAADLAPARAPARLRFAEFKLASGAADEAKVFLKEMTERTRDYLPAWLLLARIAVTEKKYDDALALLENVFGRDAGNLDAGMLQALVFSARGDAKKAIQVLERLHDAHPKLPIVQFRLAQAHLQDGNPARAGLVLKELVKAQPDYVDAVLLLGQVELRAGEREAVVDLMTGLLKKRPGLSQAQLLLADAYRALGRFDDAAEIFRQQIKATPQNAGSHFLLGIVLRQKGSLPEARAAFEKAQELAPDNLQVTSQLVELDVLAKDFSAAQQKAQGQIQRKPDSADAHFLSGRIYAAQRDWDRAEASLLKAIELDAGGSRAYDFLMSTYLEAGKLDEALSRLEKKLSAKPDDQSAMLATAIVYEKKNAFPKARDAYEKLLSRSPDFVPALNNLAGLYAERLNEPDKAYELARKARSLRPEDPSVADTLGWIFFKRGDYKQALPLLLESVAKMPGNSEIQFHLGMVQYMTGQTEAARMAFQRALTAAGDFPGKEEARKRLALLTDGAGKPGAFSSAELEALLKDKPGDVPARVRLGEAYETEGAFEKAAAAYEEVLKRDPKQLPALLKLARLNAGPLKNGAKAVEFAKKAKSLAPNDPKASEIMGLASFQARDFPGAYGLLQELIRQPDVDPATLHDFAWAAYYTGNVAQAQETMQRLLKDAPDSPHSEDAKSFLAMAALEDARKDISATEPEVQKILAASPAHVPALMVRAALLEQRGDRKAAEREYTEILRRVPDFALAEKHLASLYLADPESRAKAYPMAVKARQTLRTDPGLAQTLGQLNYEAKDFATAILFFLESGSKRQLDADGFYYLGMSYVQTKDTAKAVAILRRALEAGLAAPLATEARGVLAELEKK